jgi:hypothetical protein
MILSITILSVLVGVLGIVTFLHLRVIAELKMEVSNIDRIADLRYEGVLERMQLIEEDVEDLMEDVANQGI